MSNESTFESRWTDTAVSRKLGLAAPIVQGPFGGGLSSIELAATVCEAGGLGSFGAHHLTGDEILATASAIRARTSRPFALNLWIPHEGADEPQVTDAQLERARRGVARYYAELGVSARPRPERFWPRYAEQLDAVLEARPAVFSFVYGVPEPDVLDRCRARGIATIGTATTVDEALHLERAGVDMIVATGFEAGGHRVSFLRPPEDCLTGTLALVPQVVSAVSCPVIAAGGIADGRGVAAALVLGAAGAQIGTAFLACRESNASEAHREALFSPAAADTALTRAFTGRLARGIRNRFIDEQRDHDGDLAPYPVQAWLTAPIKAAAARAGREDLLSLWAGQAAPLLRHRDAKALFEALVVETGEALSVRR